jgi:hypothetical protein
MGGACSQKLLPWRGVAILSGAQQIFGSLRKYQLYRRSERPPPCFLFSANGAAVVLSAVLILLVTSFFVVSASQSTLIPFEAS